LKQLKQTLTVEQAREESLNICLKELKIKKSGFYEVRKKKAKP
jgi:hypothetical protein